MRLAVLVPLTLSLVACGNEVGGTGTEGAAAEAAPSGVSFSPVAADSGSADIPAASDDDGTNAGNGDDVPADSGDDGAPADSGDDDSDDGVVVPPAEAEAGESCVQWQDCGPNGGDLNSGFDCDNGQCACNVAGGYDDACRDIGGYWSDAECFCFVTSSRPPEDSVNDTNDDDAYCWWSWYEECEPNEWVDTSYYRRVCDNQGCRDVYTRRGYWRSGACDDIWIHECDDGTYQEYR